jgi:hypothetical protein
VGSPEGTPLDAVPKPLHIHKDGFSFSFLDRTREQIKNRRRISFPQGKGRGHPRVYS